MASHWADPRRGRALLTGWLAAAFAVSASTDLRVLGAAAVAALLVFRRGAARCLVRTVRSVLPVTLGLSGLSFAFLWAIERHSPAPGPYAALALRTAIIAFLGFATLERVRLLRALAPFPTLTRLLVITLAQIHALRLLATDARLGLRSRLVRKPGTRDVVRSAGAITAALLTLSTRNARDVADALRSRGF